MAARQVPRATIELHFRFNFESTHLEHVLAELRGVVSEPPAEGAQLEVFQYLHTPQ
jgi:hypothetical protein